LATVWRKKEKQRTYFDGTADGLANLDTQSRKSEFGHVLPFVLITLICSYALVRGMYYLVVFTMLINIIFNFYPVLLQRHHRMRIQRIKGMKKFMILALVILMGACSSADQKTTSTTTYPDVRVAGAMRNVMWKGELGGIIHLDTIADKTGLYGLGPVSYLTGELLINNGKAYVSKVTSDSTMSVEQTFDVKAPFFVYGNVTDWKTIDLPPSVVDIPTLEAFIDAQTQTAKRPFVFKLKGTVDAATIHIQNLPKGTTVSSPKEAHQGQVNYQLEKEEVEIVGFFSTEHKGIFTHHDTYLHMHLMTADEQKMGHLDDVTLRADAMELLLPVSASR
jgi:acetolactate decarboxylase